MKPVAVLVVTAFLCGPCAPAPAVGAQGSITSAPAGRLFVFKADDFWLNLHHFLYVLGRAKNKAPDASRDAVKGAPDEAATGLAALPDGEQQAWNAAVDVYAERLSKTGVLQPQLATLATTLAAIGDGTRDPDTIDAATHAALNGAAPIYRKVWWPRHRAQHEALLTRLQALVDQHGATVHTFLTRVYGLEWAAAGYPVHFVAYASAQGNYSLDTPDGVGLLVLSTNPNPMNAGLLPLETVFHEGMHQWDARVEESLRARGKAVGVASVPGDLSHALVFFTAGEAVRRLDSAHVPYADAAGIWNAYLFGGPAPAGRLKGPLEEIWRPFLDGRGTRDAALDALVLRVEGPSQNR